MQLEKALIKVVEELRGYTDLQTEQIKKSIEEALNGLEEVRKLASEKPIDGKDGLPGANGQDGKDADPLEVAKAVMNDPAFLLNVRGEKGEQGPAGSDGKDGTSVTVDEVKSALTIDMDFIKSITGPKGEDGLSIKAVELSDAGYLTLEFDDGQQIELGCIKGMDGKDGSDGKDGVDGQAGKDGESFNAEEFYKVFKADSELIDSLKADPEFVKAHIDAVIQEKAEELSTAVAVAKTKTMQLEMAIDQVNTAKVKTYEPEVLYKQGQWLEHKGRYYVANRDTDSVPGDSSAYSLVLRGFEFKKAWNADTKYERLDVVISSTGSAWIANKDEPQGEPGSTPDWNLLVKRGERGAKGDMGAQGPQGEKGADGVSITGISFDYQKEELHVEKSDGTKEAVDMPILTMVKDMVNGAWIIRENDMELPINDFRGTWHERIEYKRGDVVGFFGNLYIAKKATDAGISPMETIINERRHKLCGEQWRPFIVMPMPIGGGGGGGGWPSPVTSNLNMMRFGITNLKAPQLADDAATKAYVDARAGGGVVKVQDSTAFNALTGTSNAAKLNGLFPGTTTPNSGSVVMVGFNPAAGADNSASGIWHFDGTNWAHIDLTDTAGGGSVRTTGAAAVKAVSLVSTMAALATNFTGIFAGAAAPHKGDIVLVSGGTGDDAKYNGAYIYDGIIWDQLANGIGKYIFGAIKNLKTDPDPIVNSGNPYPTASIVTTSETNKKQLKALDSSANWQVIYDEELVHQWIAAGSLFQGTVKESTLNTLPTVAAGNSGQYWTWVGGSNHVVTGTDAKIGTDLAGEILNVGDWIQSNGTKWVHVPGDLLSRARWLGLGSFGMYAPGSSYEQNSLVRWKPTPTSPLRYYVANVAVTGAANEVAPGATAQAGQVQPWVDITPDAMLRTLSDVDLRTLPPSPTDVLTYDGANRVWVPGRNPIPRVPQAAYGATPPVGGTARAYVPVRIEYQTGDGSITTATDLTTTPASWRFSIPESDDAMWPQLSAILGGGLNEYDSTFEIDVDGNNNITMTFPNWAVPTWTAGDDQNQVFMGDRTTINPSDPAGGFTRFFNIQSVGQQLQIQPSIPMDRLNPIAPPQILIIYVAVTTTPQAYTQKNSTARGWDPTRLDTMYSYSLPSATKVAISCTRPGKAVDQTTGQLKPTDFVLAADVQGRPQWREYQRPAYAINDMTDVDTVRQAPANGNALVWNAGLNQWEPGSPIPAGTNANDVMTWNGTAWVGSNTLKTQMDTMNTTLTNQIAAIGGRDTLLHAKRGEFTLPATMTPAELARTPFVRNLNVVNGSYEIDIEEITTGALGNAIVPGITWRLRVETSVSSPSYVKLESFYPGNTNINPIDTFSVAWSTDKQHQTYVWPQFNAHSPAGRKFRILVTSQEDLTSVEFGPVAVSSTLTEVAQCVTKKLDYDGRIEDVISKIAILESGLAHGEAVIDILNDPPTAPTAGDIWLVGAVPTGAFQGHANDVALWDGNKWVFEAAIKPGESHYVETKKATYTWNGTAYVKTSASGDIADLIARVRALETLLAGVTRGTDGTLTHVDFVATKVI